MYSVCSRDVSDEYTIWGSNGVLLLLQLSLFQTANPKNLNLFKTPMSPEPLVSCAKDLPAKRSEKADGDQNTVARCVQGPVHVSSQLGCLLYKCISIKSHL